MVARKRFFTDLLEALSAVNGSNSGSLESVSSQIPRKHWRLSMTAIKCSKVSAGCNT